MRNVRRDAVISRKFGRQEDHAARSLRKPGKRQFDWLIERYNKRALQNEVPFLCVYGYIVRFKCT